MSAQLEALPMGPRKPGEMHHVTYRLRRTRPTRPLRLRALLGTTWGRA